jgi:hypothetical protein
VTAQPADRSGQVLSSPVSVRQRGPFAGQQRGTQFNPQCVVELYITRIMGTLNQATDSLYPPLSHEWGPLSGILKG